MENIATFKHRAQHIQLTLSCQNEAVIRSAAEEAIVARLESYRRLGERLRLTLSHGGVMGGTKSGNMGGGAIRGGNMGGGWGLGGGGGMGGGNMSGGGNMARGGNTAGWTMMTEGGATLSGLPDGNEGFLGPLCDLFVPKDPSRHQIALLAVLGSTLTHTIVVQTRTLAVAAASICREMGITGVTFDILEEVVMVNERGELGNGEGRGEERGRGARRGEIGGCNDNLRTGNSNSSSSSRGSHNNNNNNNNNNNGNSNNNTHPKITSLLDCIQLLVPLASPCIRKRLDRWVYFEGTTSEALQYVQRLPRRDVHVVSADGSRFFADGVIQLHGGMQVNGGISAHGRSSGGSGASGGGSSSGGSGGRGGGGGSGGINTSVPLPLWPSSHRLQGMTNSSTNGLDQSQRAETLKLSLAQLR